MEGQSPIVSMELFPPKTPAGMQNLQQTVDRLGLLRPEYFSVTYGAGGSTQDRTFSTVDMLRKKNLVVVPHLSCVGIDKAGIRRILERYRAQGIDRIVALRGDLPSGSGPGSLGELHYANELVAFIGQEFPGQFAIEVAAYPEFHPQAESPESDLDHFQRKVESGASGAITQYFFNPDAYLQFVDACRARNIGIPIVPGIMPITNFAALARFSDACGAEIPRWIRKRLEYWSDDIDSIQAFGCEVVTRLCQRLLDAGAPGLHFYTMNQADPVLQICQNLGIGDP